jgi:hypothetical protein
VSTSPRQGGLTVDAQSITDSDVAASPGLHKDKVLVFDQARRSSCRICLYCIKAPGPLRAPVSRIDRTDPPLRRWNEARSLQR